MKYKTPGQCPVCGHELSVSKLTCTYCPTKIEGEFLTCKFCQLPNEQREFVEIFMKCRGNIKDVEKELGISYPTVRNRLDGVIEALGYKVEARLREDDADFEEEKKQRQEILDALERGEISPPEAAKQLKRMGK